MKKTVILSSLALTTALLADGNLVAAEQKMNGSSQSQMMKQNQQMMDVVTLTSARPESDNGWYLFADALYWHADVGNTDWAIKYPNTSPSDIILRVKDHALDFKWSWGFKAGIGVNMDHDMWDSNLYFTWFRTHNSNRAGVNPNVGGVIDNIGSFGFYTTGKIDWRIQFSMIDWELGRQYFVSPRLALRPHIGIKGGWIHQNVHMRVQNQQVGTLLSFGNEHFKNHFWGVGPSAGVNTMWILGYAGSESNHRFSLNGDFSGALMYGHFQNSDQQTFTSIAGTVVGGQKVHDLNRNLAVTTLQGIFSLSWDVPFNHNRNHFMMKVGYELQYWFRQNQFAFNRVSDNVGLPALTRLSDDLALQGITVDFRFDF